MTSNMSPSAAAMGQARSIPAIRILTVRFPVVKDGASTVFEQTAIALYLADKFPDARLVPTIADPARGRFSPCSPIIQA